MKLYAISDLHGQLDGLDPQDADVVLIAGDFAPMEGWSYIDLCNQVDWVKRRFCKWCAGYPKARFVVIPGNHDLFAQHPEEVEKIGWPQNTTLLIDSTVEVSGIRIYGTPWVPFINGCWAFEEAYRGQLRDKFAAIPDGIEILVTHSPPLLPRKKVDISIDNNAPHFGSQDLTDVIMRIRPRYVFCGHIHTGDHGPVVLTHPDGSTTTVRNVSRLDERYRIRYEPVQLEI